jgi:hypothetical protein
MAGWDLKVGEIKQIYVTDEDIWKALVNDKLESTVFHK